MIEKSPEMKIHEQTDAMMQSFRTSVREAQRSAKASGVPVTLVLNGQRYNAMPDGEMVATKNPNSE